MKSARSINAPPPKTPPLKGNEVIKEAERLEEAWNTHHGPAHNGRIRTRKMFALRQLKQYT